VHVSSAADFHAAVMGGADEIVHSGGPSPFNTIDNAAITPELQRDPRALGSLFVAALSGTGSTASTYRPIAVEDARLAAQRGITVITTILGVTRAPEPVRAAVRPPTAANLKTLRDSGVRLVIGSDNVADTSRLEFEQLATLGVFDNLSLLNMWAETTPQAIFPDRRIGRLQDGFEASFLVLAGNPLEDLGNVRRITMRVKQGLPLQPSAAP
jgi:imidazolonepropionase-like amidohydrolase